MVTIRQEYFADFSAREALLNEAFGAERFRKTSERLRKGQQPAAGLAFSAVDAQGHLIGSLRLWPIVAGAAGEALLLGPLAVAADYRGQGVGGALMRYGLAQAASLGHRAVLLVGDADYYQRFGFDAGLTEKLQLPGPVERARFLGLELVAGALTEARGMVRAKRPVPQRQAA